MGEARLFLNQKICIRHPPMMLEEEYLSMKEEVFSCSCCGQIYQEDELFIVDNDYMCEACAASSTFVCERCGNRYQLESNYGNDETPLCECCYYDGSYHICGGCGRVIAGDEAHYLDDDEMDPFCWECFVKRQEACRIHEYSYKPEPNFYGTAQRFFGVELEMDYGGRDEWNAGEILDAVNDTDQRIYIKGDSSLDDGFEIVTHPMSLTYHKNEMPWAELCDKAIALGYLSHKTNTCGLHIHVNRMSLGQSYAQQEVRISKILLLMEKFWPEMVRFSRRTASQLEKWAQRYGFEKRGREILDKAKKGALGRYASVNLENTNTIEFRIFRGTLKVGTLLAALELVDQLCDHAVNMAEEEIQDLSWTDFVSGLPSSCPELIQYLKERRLYVNAPVDGEEDL